MATEAQVQTAIADAVRILEHLDRYVNTNTQNFAGHRSTLESDVGPNSFEFADSVFAAASRFRAGLVNVTLLGDELLTPLILEMGKALDFPETDVGSILTRWRQNFRDRGLTVETRTFNFGAISSTSVVSGDGTINRLTTDENGDDIEATWAETVEAECVRDEHSGAREHQETFQFRGQARGKDQLELQGSGQKRLIDCRSASDSLEFLQNPSFSDNTVGALASGDTIAGWDIDVGSATDFTIVDATTGFIYRGFEGDSDPRALLIESNSARISQNFNNRRVELFPNIPMYLQIAWRPAGAVAGTLQVRLGSQTSTVSVTSASSGWNVLRLELGTRNWFANFNQEDPLVEIDWVGNGSIYIDDVVLSRFTLFNGIFYAPVGGATPFLRKDAFNWSHTAGDRVAGTQGLIQHWLWRVFNFYLPGNISPSWADPNT